MGSEIMMTLPEKNGLVRGYPILFALEVAGAIIILWHGVPIYRRLLEGALAQEADLAVIAWAIVGSLLIQVPYWISTLKVFRLLAVPRHIFAGHVVIFLARLNFVFVGGLFSAVVIVRAADLEFVPWRAALLAGVLFSMFCFSIELERLGKLLLDG
jgi:hypothetical protein